jgi:hypothetical protein
MADPPLLRHYCENSAMLDENLQQLFSFQVAEFSSSWRILEPCDLDDGYLADLLMRNTEFLRD